MYDEARAEARLALCEQQSRLPHETEELAKYRDRTLFPKIDESRRHAEIDTLQRSIEHRRHEIARLTPIVSDPETVIDQNGRLPGERREAMRLHYRFERQRRVLSSLV